MRVGVPSDYELDAWAQVQRFRGRPLSRTVREAGTQIAGTVSRAGKHVAEYVAEHPHAAAAAGVGRKAAGRGVHAVGAAARGVGNVVGDGVLDWGRSAAGAVQHIAARVARAGLSPDRVVRQHQKRGHDVLALADVRRLDLQDVDAVRGRAAAWYYPLFAGLSGAGAGLVITGGEFTVTVSAGVGAAPSATVVVGAVAADMAVVLGLASRCVGQVALSYGYDPEDPAEKLFVMSVVNAGTAASTTAKTVAMADVSRLTQALVRGKTWAVLDRSLVSQVSKRFTQAFGVRFTKQSLGKVVPAAGIILGGAFNWATLEQIVDAAGVAYRRRFLLEKYPQLGDGDSGGWDDREDRPSGGSDSGGIGGVDDEDISVIDQIADAGGPDLRR